MTPSSSSPDPPAGFFKSGGTLEPNAPSYVVRQADAELYTHLQQGEFCYVLTSRQMGKSSLMGRTAARLRREGVAVAVIDLTLIGQNLSAEQWYASMLERIGQHLDLEDELEQYWLAHPQRSPLQRWLGALHEVVLARCPGRVVIFVDEIDAIRSLPFSTDEYFAAVRACFNRRTEEPEFARLTFCLLGVATPSDLIEDTRTTPFNIGRRVELTDFTEAEVAALAPGLGRSEALGRALLKRVLYWTGGHPQLTQRLCQAVAEDASVGDSGGVDRLCVALFLSHGAQERDDNLLFVRDRLLRSEADTAGLLDLYRRVRLGAPVQNDERNRLVGILRLSGITRVAEGKLRVRNRIYERVFDRAWITQHMPDAEVRRQRAAYRMGLLRAAGVAGVIIALVSGLAFSAMSAAHQARVATNHLKVALRKEQETSRELQRALDAVRTQSQRAQRAEGAERARRQQALDASAKAEQERRRAEEQEQIALSQKSEAERQQERAEQQRRRADRLGKQTDQAVDAIVDLADVPEKLRDVSGSVMTRILAEICNANQKTLEAAPDTPAVIRAKAVNGLLQAEMLRRQGQLPKSLRCFRETVAKVTRMVTQNRKPGDLRMLALFHATEGLLWEDLGRLDGNPGNYEKALSDYSESQMDAQIADGSGDGKALRVLWNSYLMRADLLRRLHRLDEAENACREGLRLSKTWEKDQPADLSDNYKMLAQILRSQGDDSNARGNSARSTRYLQEAQALTDRDSSRAVTPDWSQAGSKSVAVLLSYTSGTTVMRSAGGPSAGRLQHGLPLQAGCVVQTDATGQAEILFRDGRQVKLDRNTALRIPQNRGDLLQVLRGKVFVRVAPRTPLYLEGVAAAVHVHG